MKNLLLLLLLPLTLHSQAYNGLGGIPAELLTPPPIEEKITTFTFTSPIYINVKGNDTIYQHSTQITVTKEEVVWVTGKDTTTRKIYGYSKRGIELSCGDSVEAVMGWDGEVYGMWYRKGEDRFYYCKKWRKEYIK